MRSYLIKPVNHTALLVVPETDLFLYQSLELLGMAYSVARLIYPNITSLLPVTGVVYNLIQTGDVILTDIQLL